MTDRYADGKPVPDERMSADRYASWLLLELGEQGRPEEQIAQFLASVWITSEADQNKVLDDLQGILSRTVQLMMEDGNDIWPHLMPMGSTGDPLEHPDTTRLHKAVEIVGEDASPEEILEGLSEFFANEGLITERDDSNMYGSFTVVQVDLLHGSGDIVVDEPGNLWHWWTRTTGFRLVDGHDTVGATVEIHANDVKKLDGSEVHELLN